MSDKSRRAFLRDSVRTGLGVLGASRGNFISQNSVQRNSGEGENTEDQLIKSTVMPPDGYMFREETMVLIGDISELEVAYFPTNSIENSTYQKDLLEYAEANSYLRKDEIKEEIGVSWDQIQSESYEMQEIEPTKNRDGNSHDIDKYSQSIDEWLKTNW